MASRFDRVIGTDPSPGMIKQAKEQNTMSNVEFHQGSAESTPFLSDGSVDCIVAGQSSHWFDYPKLWPEMKRLLRSGGTLAFWGYKDPALVDYPEATKVLDRNTYGDDPETMGPYWSMPGRRYVQEKLRVIQPPPDSFENVERIEYEPACNGPRRGEGTIFMEKQLTIAEMKDYYRTWSSFHGWQEAHPDEIARARGGKGDLLDRMFDEIGEKINELKDEQKVVNMEWGSGLVMARKK
jgi:trans-aconitate 3-methyltransferase